MRCLPFRLFTIRCPSSSSFTLLVSGASNSMSLGLLTNCEESARSLAASGQPTWLENFWVRLQQLPGPRLLTICPSKFPKVATPAPALGSGIKESTFGTHSLHTEGKSLWCVQLETLFPLHSVLILWNKPICFIFEWGTLMERGKNWIFT